MRNSSLDEWEGAEDVRRLKPYTEAVDLRKQMVGERFLREEVVPRGKMDCKGVKMLA